MFFTWGLPWLAQGPSRNFETTPKTVPTHLLGCPGPFPKWVLWWGHYHILVPPAEPRFDKKSLTHSGFWQVSKKMDEFESLLLMLQTMVVVLFKDSFPFKHLAFLEGLTHSLKPFDGQQNTKWDSCKELTNQWYFKPKSAYLKGKTVFSCVKFPTCIFDINWLAAFCPPTVVPPTKSPQSSATCGLCVWSFPKLPF